MTRPHWVVTDMIAVLALVGIAEVGMARLFEGWGYVVVAEVAAALGLMVALVTVRLPVAILVTAVPLVGLVLGGPVSQVSQGLGAGLLDPGTITDVLQGTWTSWGELLTTLPWVDLEGAPALVPFLIGYLGAVLAGALALRTRSAGGPILPLLVALAIALLMRRGGGTGSAVLDWFPVMFVGVAIGWLALRSLRIAPGATARGAGHGRVVRALMAVLVVAAAMLVAVPVTVPMSADGGPAPVGKSLRGHQAAPSDLSGLDSPLRRFRTFTDQGEGSLNDVHDKLLFTVTGAPAGSRVRMATLDTYDGHEWLPGNNSILGASDDAFLRLDSRVDDDVQGRQIRARISVTKAYASAWMPMVGALQSLRMVFADPRGQRSEMRYNLATSSAVLPTGIGRRDSYEVDAVVAPDNLDLSVPGWLGPGQRSVSGTRQVEGFQPRVLDAPIPAMHKVFLLAGYLREQGRYSDGALPGEQQYEAGHDLDRLVDGFLMAPRPVGDDEQYASAMALLANRVGVPARVVVGAVLPRGGKVRGEDVHAWVELRVFDGSWRTLDTREFMSRRPPRAVMPPAAPLQVPTTTQPQQQPDRPARDDTHQDRPSPGQGTAGAIRFVPWLVLLVLALVVPSTKSVRRWRRLRRGRSSDRMAGAWTELVDHARDLGLPVEPDASRPAQARAMALSGAPALSRAADDGVFAAEEPSSGSRDGLLGPGASRTTRAG